VNRLLDQLLQLPRRRELRRQPRETEFQILRRRDTLIPLKTFVEDDGRHRVLVVMAYMTEL
jgi:hypothetical protein